MNMTYSVTHWLKNWDAQSLHFICCPAGEINKQTKSTINVTLDKSSLKMLLQTESSHSCPELFLLHSSFRPEASCVNMHSIYPERAFERCINMQTLWPAVRKYLPPRKLFQCTVSDQWCSLCDTRVVYPLKSARWYVTYNQARVSLIL